MWRSFRNTLTEGIRTTIKCRNNSCTFDEKCFYLHQNRRNQYRNLSLHKANIMELIDIFQAFIPKAELIEDQFVLDTISEMKCAIDGL